MVIFHSYVKLPEGIQMEHGCPLRVQQRGTRWYRKHQDLMVDHENFALTLRINSPLINTSPRMAVFWPCQRDPVLIYSLFQVVSLPAWLIRIIVPQRFLMVKEVTLRYSKLDFWKISHWVRWFSQRTTPPFCVRGFPIQPCLMTPKGVVHGDFWKNITMII